MKSKQEIEKKLSQTLTEGQMKKDDREPIVRNEIFPKYEIRIPATMDPIVEETEIIRSMAKEVDDRYDEYISRTKAHNKPKPD